VKFVKLKGLKCSIHAFFQAKMLEKAHEYCAYRVKKCFAALYGCYTTVMQPNAGLQNVYTGAWIENTTVRALPHFTS
jgi:hypothetical protein